MSIAELRLPHDASFKSFVQNPEFMRHLLRAEPLQDLDEAEVVEIEEARSNLIHPDLSQRVVDAAWKLTLRGRRAWSTCWWNASPRRTHQCLFAS